MTGTARGSPPPRRRAHLSLTPLEDRTVPTAVVTVEVVHDGDEDGTNGSFRFNRTGSTSSALTVYFTGGGSATSSDYSGLGTSVTIPAGQASADKGYTVINDSVTDPDETVSVAVSYGPGYVSGSPNTATSIIADNEGVRRSALYLDFTNSRANSGFTMKLKWKIKNTTTGVVTTDEVTLSPTSACDAQEVRDLTQSALDDNNFVTDDKENNRLIIKAPVGYALVELDIVMVIGPQGGWSHPRLRKAITGDGGVEPVYKEDGVQWFPP